MADGRHNILLDPNVKDPGSVGPGNANLPFKGSVSGKMLGEAMKGPSGPAPSLQEQSQPKR